MPSTQLSLFNPGASTSYSTQGKRCVEMSPSFNPNTTVGTIAGWINLNKSSYAQNCLLSAGHPASNVRNWWGFGITSAKKLMFRATSWSATAIEATTALSSGVWYHVAVTQDGTNLRFYINGQIDRTVATNRWWSTYGEKNNLFILGGTDTNSTYASNYGRPLDARGQGVQLWDVKLEDSEINTLYNNGQPLLPSATQPQANNLIYYFFPTETNWSLQKQDILGTTTFNNGKGYRISYDAKASLSTTECFSTTDGNISTGDPQGFTLNSNTVSGSLTLSGWFNWVALGNSRRFKFFKLVNSDGEIVSFEWLLHNGVQNIYCYVAGASVSNVSSTTSQGRLYGWPNSMWQNIIIHIPNASSGWNTNQVRFWLNGKEHSFFTTDSSQTSIQSISGFTPGTIGMSISNFSAFEDLEINDNNIKTISGAEPSDISSLNPKVWYKLNSQDISFATSGDKATAITITDSSGNNLNATGAYDYDE